MSWVGIFWQTLTHRINSFYKYVMRLLCSLGRVAQGKTQVRADLGLHTQEIPEPEQPVDNYRPHQSTTLQPLHSWSSTEGRGWWSVVTASHYSWLAWVNPSHWPDNSNQGATTRGGCPQPTQRAHLEYPGKMIGEAVTLNPTGHLLY